MPDEVVYVTESSGFGGAEKYLLQLTEAALARCHKVSAALPTSDANIEVRRRLAAQNLELLPLRQCRANYLLNLFNALLFFRKNKKALYHFSLPHSDSCRWLLLAASLLRLRYFITEHSVPPDPYRESLYFAVTHILFNPLKKLSYRCAEKVITVSCGNRHILIERYGMPADKIEVIYNGIDCSAYKSASTKAAKLRSEFTIPPDCVILTNVGRLNVLKGQMYLITAFQLIIKRHPNLRLLLVGDGPLKSQLEDMVLTKGLKDQVKLVGFREDIADILSLSDIFILPSVREGFAFTVLEAMAAGKPIVATRVSGTAEAVLDGESGYLCNVADPNDLAEKISKLLVDKTARETMGGKGRELVVKEFDIQRMIEKTLALYESSGLSCAGR
jgi:glycosyltransferase involved in cell wall biosynthesis